ncbi:MAG: growth inhibitor PemK [Alphaproteobacteria bacterium]
MSLPEPVPGLVIRHAFLWSHEAGRGQSEAAKARPCAIVIATARRPHGPVRVTVAPITHSPPDDIETCVEFPVEIARSLGLDDGRQWLRFDELNVFDWPGFDLSPIPGSPSKFAYGMLPRGFFETVKRAMLERIRSRKRPSILSRDE